jgi:hypothetical protein
MNRGLIFLGGAACALLASAATANTIVQTAGDPWSFFYTFDPQLGTLLSVTLDASGTGIRTIFVPASPSSVDVSWSLDSYQTITIDQLIGPPLPNPSPGQLYMPLTASGSATIQPPGPSYIQFMATGSATFQLNPAWFVQAVRQSTYDLYIDFGDNSLHDPTSIVINTNPQVAAVDGQSCYGAPNLQAICDQMGYTLTYTYAPVGSALPEPSTWATMLLGFGVIGGAMRKRTRLRASAYV